MNEVKGASLENVFSKTGLADLVNDGAKEKIDPKELDKPLRLSNESDLTTPKKMTENLNEENKGLTKGEKDQVKMETGWSDEVVDAIGSKDEYKIYKEAGVEEVEIDGNKGLVKTDIDYDKKDSMGRTNAERMETGLAPINEKGERIELHHMGQASGSPLAELSMKEHRGIGNDAVLHDKTKVSEIDRNKFNTEKEKHWKERANGGKENE